MRLHHLIERLQEHINKEKNKPALTPKLIKFQNEIIEKSKELIFHINQNINEYVQIDIGRLYYDLPVQQVVELQEYSIDMIKNGLNIFPYDSMVLSFFYEREAIIIIEKHEEVVDTFFMSDMKLSGFSSLPFSQGFINSFFIMKDTGEFKTESTILFDPEETMTKKQEDIIKRVGSSCLQIILAVCAIMNSQNVELTTTPAPKRLNEKRAKKGKPPIGEIKEIRINYGGKRYMIDGREEGGTHASPRLHWRRGHVRRLASGKITNVRPTLVGSIKGEEPKMPVYKITNTKERQFDDEAESSKERKQTDCRVYNSNGAECGQSVAHQRALETEVGD